jgi:hypothetical protein
MCSSLLWLSDEQRARIKPHLLLYRSTSPASDLSVVP